MLWINIDPLDQSLAITFVVTPVPVILRHCGPGLKGKKWLILLLEPCRVICVLNQFNF